MKANLQTRTGDVLRSVVGSEAILWFKWSETNVYYILMAALKDKYLEFFVTIPIPIKHLVFNTHFPSVYCKCNNIIFFSYYYRLKSWITWKDSNVYLFYNNSILTGDYECARTTAIDFNHLPAVTLIIFLGTILGFCLILLYQLKNT